MISSLGVDLHGDEDEEELEQLYFQLEAKEKAQIEEMRTIAADRSVIDENLIRLQSLVPRVDQLEMDGGELTERLNRVKNLADQVSRQIRFIDSVRTRVDACYERVEDLLDLSKCVEGIKVSMHNEEYELAAGHIHRYLLFDKEVLLKCAESSTLDASFKLLKDAEMKLKAIVNDKFNEAMETDDEASTQRFFKIFPLLNLHEEGLKKFSTYQSRKVEKFAREDVEQAISSDKQRFKFAIALSKLLEKIAGIIDYSKPLIETYYGFGKLIIFVETLQQQCDERAEIIFSEFRRQRQMPALIDSIEKYRRKKTSSEIRFDREILTEILKMTERFELYNSFLRRRLLVDEKIAADDAASRDINRFLNSNALANSMHQTTGYYVQIEEFLITDSVQKAMSAAAASEDEVACTVSPMIDDVFFVYKESLERAANSRNVNILSAVLNHVMNSLEAQLAKAIRVQSNSIFQSYLSVEKNNQTILAINNLAAAINNICLLLESDWLRRSALSKTEKIATILEDFNSLQEKLSENLDLAVSKLIDSSVKPRIRLWLESLASTNFNMNEEDLEIFEASDPWIDQLMTNLHQVVGHHEAVLVNEHALKSFSMQLIEALIVALEQQIRKQTYSRLGALAIERAVRKLVNYSMNYFSWSARENFTRLTQICSVLNVENECEIIDLFGDGYSWQLSTGEIKAVLSLRCEFSLDSINKLRL